MKASFELFKIWKDKSDKNYQERHNLNKEELHIRDNCVKDIYKLIKELANNFNKKSTKYKIGYHIIKFSDSQNLDYSIVVVLMPVSRFGEYESGKSIYIKSYKEMKELPVTVNWCSEIDDQIGLNLYNKIKKTLEEA